MACPDASGPIRTRSRAAGRTLPFTAESVRVQVEQVGESVMRVGYVVLYVNDAETCRRFWVDQVGMVEKRRTDAGTVSIVQVGFADQPFAFELVPLELMKDNPDGLDLATPSIAFHVDDLQAAHDDLVARDVQATDVGEHEGTPSFAFSDPEGRWFAVTRA
jgi:lactoylglutathione lyase